MQKNCAAILPWTEAAKKSLLASIPRGTWTEKVRTVYPCIDASKFISTTRKNKRTINFLFVGGGFILKGGIETIKAFKKASQRIDACLTIVSNVDETIRKQYAHVRGLRFMSKVPQEELEQLYATADVFIMPSHYDTFGLVYLEAMARGLPCIGTTQFATPEIIENGKTGILVKNYTSRFDNSFRPYRSHEGNDTILQDCRNPPRWAIDQLAEAMIRIAEDDASRRAMGREGLREVTTGRFSIAARKRVMREVYGDVTNRT
jgi:glycosyltransferase involved in cell wall biosynthesis